MQRWGRQASHSTTRYSDAFTSRCKLLQWYTQWSQASSKDEMAPLGDTVRRQCNGMSVLVDDFPLHHPWSWYRRIKLINILAQRQHITWWQKPEKVFGDTPQLSLHYTMVDWVTGGLDIPGETVDLDIPSETVGLDIPGEMVELDIPGELVELDIPGEMMGLEDECTSWKITTRP